MTSWLKKKVGSKVTATKDLAKGNVVQSWKEGSSYNTLMNNFGQNTSKQDAAQKKAAQARTDQYNDTQGVLGKMNKSDSDYLSKMKTGMDTYQASRAPIVSDYIGKQKDLEDQATNQARDASVAYSSEIQPRLKGIMEQSQQQADQAMSLQDAGDPNNKVQQAVRSMYNNQASEVGKRGLQDVGVLNALGSQATSNQMSSSGAPTTGSQLQLLNANNQSQSGAAFAKTQQQMQGLRQQGIDQGFTQSANQYDRGVNAKNAYSNSVGAYGAGVDQNIARQQNLRGEQQGYNSDIFGTNLGVAREDYGMGTGYDTLNHNLDQGQGERAIGSINQKYGGQQQTIKDQIAQANASNAAKAGYFKAGAQAVGTGIGSYFGGAAGGQAGNSMGSAVGQGAQTGGQQATTGPDSNYQQQNYRPQNPYAAQNQGYYA